MRARCISVLAAVGVLSAPAFPARDAHAAGLYFSDRGVRPLGRGGAFVAGADDLNATWYNPAGLADAGTSFLLDASWLNFSSTFTRQTNVPSAAGTVYTDSFPTVAGSTKFIPIPTVGGSYRIGKVTLALAVFSPYTAIPVTRSSSPTAPPPRRATPSSPSTESALAVTGLWMAYKPVRWFQFGLGVRRSSEPSTPPSSSAPVRRRASSAPRKIRSTTPSPSSRSNPIFAPSANGGLTFTPEKHVRIGLSGQLPMWVDAPATISVRLPNAPEFDAASQQGNSAHVKFTLPAVVRIGVEGRFNLAGGGMRVEATYEREFWDEHQSIDIQPDNVTLLGIKGFPSPFAVSPISIPRHFQDSNSFRLGAEYSFTLAGYGFDARIGGNYETSAIPTAYLSPLTVDMNKFFLGLGGSLHIAKHWRLDAMYGHVFASSVYVDPAVAAVPKVNPVQGNPVNGETVNGGTYTATADVLGVGLNYRF